MKRKFLVFICVTLLAVLCLTACAQVDEEAELRKDGYNIVVTFDCGNYAKRTVTPYEDAEKIQYGEVAVENNKDFIIGHIGIESYSVRSFFYNSTEACVFEPGQIEQIKKASLVDRVFVEWRVATVVEYKLDSNGQPIKNAYGQYEYGKVVPQDTDVAWDFSQQLGSYQNNPYAVRTFVYDGTKSLEAQVTVNGQTTTNGTTYTDEQLGYGENKGFNIYLYAVWNVQPKFVVEADLDGDGTWEEILRTAPNTYDKYKVNDYDLKKDGYTYYGIYADKNFTTPWDMDTKFQNAYQGTQDGLRPYVILYAKYLEGDWSVVRTPAQLSTALKSDKNVYLDADLTISNWSYIKEYSAEFKGNGHTITLTGKVVNNPADSKKEWSYEACGLFGVFSGKMSDVTFNDVEINVSKYPMKAMMYCGVFAGRVAEGASFANVTVNGKITYSESIASDANKDGGIAVYVGGNADISTNSWYGNMVGTITGLTYVDTALI